MQTAEFADDFVAGPKPEMVGIPQNNLSAQFLDFLRVKRFHRSLGADGHENRRFDSPVGQN